MKTDFRVSVIVPCFNYGRFLAETVESVLVQTLPPHQIIVVDDGSTDDTAEVAARYADRIQFIQQENRGVSAARNNGIDNATGNWLAFLDADDVWEPEFLARLRPICIDNPLPAIVFTDYRTFGTVDGLQHPSDSLRTWDPEKYLLSPYISVMPSATVVRAGFGVRFPEWAGSHDEDAIFFNDVAHLGPVRCVAEPLMRYRKHPTSAQARTAARPLGCENLRRWATERELSYPGTVHRLFRTLAALIESARWSRNWPRYWMLRDFCIRYWPADLPKSAVLRERVWPQAVYRFKDAIDRIRDRVGGRA